MIAAARRAFHVRPSRKPSWLEAGPTLAIVRERLPGDCGGLRVEFPLTDREDILKNRVYADLIVR
jgi:hypothetical protein